MNTKYTHRCEACGKQYKTQDGTSRFCTTECEQGVRTCTKCGETKNLNTDFYYKGNTGKFDTQCKVCVRDIQAGHRPNTTTGKYIECANDNCFQVFFKEYGNQKYCSPRCANQQYRNQQRNYERTRLSYEPSVQTRLELHDPVYTTNSPDAKDFPGLINPAM